MINNKTYDYLKYIALIFIPALTAFIGTVGLTLNWQYTDVTVVIMTAFNTFLGTLLGISTNQYNKKESDKNG